MTITLKSNDKQSNCSSRRKEFIKVKKNMIMRMRMSAPGASSPIQAAAFFSKWKYIAIASVGATTFWIQLRYFDQVLFFSPILVFHFPIPKDLVGAFILSEMTFALLGIMVSMNEYYYVFRYSTEEQLRTRAAGAVSSTPALFSASSLGVFSGLCARYTPTLRSFIGSLFGSGAGIALSSFLSTCQHPVRIVSIVILICRSYSVSREVITTSSRVYRILNHGKNSNNNNDQISI